MYLVVNNSQHAGAGHTLFDQLGRPVSRDRCSFTAPATVDHADVLDETDLHRHDIHLLTGLFTMRNFLPFGPQKETPHPVSEVEYLAPTDGYISENSPLG